MKGRDVFWKSMLLLLFMSVDFLLSGQESGVQTKDLIRKLSMRRDPGMKTYQAVYGFFQQMDSTARCQFLHELETQCPKSNKAMRIRLNFLKTYAAVYYWCPSAVPLEQLMKENLLLAYEIEDPFLITMSHQALMEEYNRQIKIGLGVMHGLIAKEMQEANGIQNFPGKAFQRYNLGYLLYQSREYEAAIPVLRESITGFDTPITGKRDALDNWYKMFAWNTLGLAYAKQGNAGLANEAFVHAKQIADHDQNHFWGALIGGNQGDVLFQQGEYDSAYVLLAEDVHQSLIAGQYDNAANSLQWMARIELIKGNPQSALKKLREADTYLARNRKPEFQANIYYAYAQVFKALENADSLHANLEKYLVLHDSLEREASDNRAEIVQMRLDNQASVHQILLLNKEKRRIKLFRNFSILVILLASGIGLMYYTRERMRMRIYQEKALEAKRKAEEEAASALEKLNDFTHRMLEKNVLIEKLQEQLIQKEMTEAQVLDIQALSRHTILTDEDWEHFKQLFDQVYPGFFIRLKDMAPDITLAELRMAALSKLRVTAKEASSLLGISHPSVYKTRQRLRSRLNLGPEMDLEIYFSQEFGG